MSVSASPGPALASHAATRWALVRTTVVTTGTALTLTAIGAHDLAQRLVLTPVINLTSALRLGVVVRRRLSRRTAGNAALTMSLLALLLDVTPSWTGVPFVLRVAGAMLGWAGHSSSHGSLKADAAFVLGSLVAMSSLAIYAADLLAH